MAWAFENTEKTCEYLIMESETSSNSETDALSTRDILVRTAERLFAEKGIEGVALRAIGAEAGQGNSVAVQYHFKNRAGLIQAILEWRWQRIETGRSEMLEALLAKDPDPRLEDLLVCLQQPLVDMTDEDGRHNFARFLLHYLTSSNRWFIDTGNGVKAWLSPDRRENEQPTFKLLDCIADRIPHVPRPVAGRRLTQCMRMLMGTIVDWENAQAVGQQVAPLEKLIADQSSMIAAAIAAPVPESSRTFIREYPAMLR